jgi:hypothetical protein
MAKKNPTKPTKPHASGKDLDTRNGEDVKAGATLTFAQVKPTYMPQKPDGQS